MGLKSVQRTIKDVCINLEKNEEYKEMKKENNYISTEMNHKKLIVGVVIIHVCFMLIGASGIISTLKEKNIIYGLLINMIYQLTLIIMIGVAYSKSREEAEDNLQDGFIKVLESIDQYKGKGSFEGWMKRIFINTALEKFRKNRSVQVVEEVPEVVDEDDFDNDVSIPPEVLFEFVNELPEKYRLVFNLYVMEDMQHKEIAALLGISDGTSKSNLARAKEILKRKINAYLRDE